MIEIDVLLYIISLITAVCIGILIHRIFTYRKYQYVMRLSEIDQMTQLLNYQKFDKILDQYCEKETVFSLLLIDIDNLKQINDSSGYNEADKIIRSFANELRSLFRADDIIARYKIGDEFIVLLPSVNKIALQNICERIIRSNTQNSLSATEWHIRKDSKESIIQRLENALNTAKQNKPSYIIV